MRCFIWSFYSRVDFYKDRLVSFLDNEKYDNRCSEDRRHVPSLLHFQQFAVSSSSFTHILDLSYLENCLQFHACWKGKELFLLNSLHFNVFLFNKFIIIYPFYLLFINYFWIFADICCRTPVKHVFEFYILLLFMEPYFVSF